MLRPSVPDLLDEIAELKVDRSDLIRRIRECEERSLAFERRAMEAEERLATQAQLRAAGLL